MRTCRAFIISASPLFVDAITHLLEEEGAEVVAQAKNLEDARPMLGNCEVDAIVVDRNDIQLRDAEVVSHLMDSDREQQIVLLTIAGNEMVVYHKEKLENVTPHDLVKAICVKEAKRVS